MSWKRDSYHLGHYDKRSKTGRERQILFLSLKCGLSKEITNTETERIGGCQMLEVGGGAHYQGKDDQKAKLPVPKKIHLKGAIYTTMAIVNNTVLHT